MFKRILFITAAILILILLWQAFRTFQSSPTNVLSNIFNIDFISTISSQVTSGLSSSNSSRPAQVDIDELGEFSPVAGLVEITKAEESMQVNDINYEYIEIRAKADNAQPINISNWSLQSMVSDVWIGIPQGTELFVIGEVNTLQDIYLRPGERAIIATRQSPVGVSFRVNRCSGFLNNTQDFEPPMNTLCIAPRDLVPPTIDNLKLYGDSCVDFVDGIRRCTYVTGNEEGFELLSQTCRDRIQTRLTYNYCTNAHMNDSDFYQEQEWRIFLNQNTPLWREKYEIIRLLDEQHRTIDVISY